MGSEFLTIDQTAQKLGKSKKTVHTYLDQGLLRRIYEPKPKGAPGRRRVLIPLEDVEELAINIGAGFPPMNKKNFFRLWAHVQRLEAEMVVAKKALGFGGSPMRPSRDEALGFFQMASRALAEGRWQLDEVRAWADLFERVDEVFFDMMAGYVPGVAWKPFYDLCLALMRQVSCEESFKTSLDLQTLHQRLSQGMKLIRQTVLVLIEAGYGKTTDETLAEMDGPKEALLRHLSAKAPVAEG